MPLPRLRLFIACAAAGGMSAVFHTPLAGGLFVCEIVIGVMSIDILAPLLVASCASYVTVIVLFDPSPLYEMSDAHLNQSVAVAFFALLLGVISSLLAKFWLVLLSKMREILNGNQYLLPLRLTLAGVIVGSVAIYYPEIVGNGAHIIRGIVSANFTLEQVFVLLCLKIAAVALFFGMGAIGGVLTPSLTIGSMTGFLFAHVLIMLGVPLSSEEVIGFSLLGMASFFTTAAAAPITSLLLVVEFTFAGKMIFPLTIGVLTSHFISKISGAKSMYASAVSKNILPAFNKPMAQVKIENIFRKSSDTVLVSDRFSEISKKFSAKIGIHAHNDTGMAVASTLAAVENGARHVQGTFLGFGERAGNANLSTVICNLKLKTDYDVDVKIETTTLVGRKIAEIANITLDHSMPYIGKNAFFHKAGAVVIASMDFNILITH